MVVLRAILLLAVLWVLIMNGFCRVMVTETCDINKRLLCPEITCLSLLVRGYIMLYQSLVYLTDFGVVFSVKEVREQVARGGHGRGGEGRW